MKPGVNVALYLPNTPHYLIAFFGVLKAGGTVVNYSPLDAAKVLEHLGHPTSLVVQFGLARRLGRAAATSPERLPCSPEHPVEGRFAGQVGPLVRKLGHDLVGRQTGAVASIGRLQDSLALCFAEFVARHFALGCGPAIEGSYAPALQGSLFQAQFAAGLGLPGSGSNRFVNQLDGFAAI